MQPRRTRRLRQLYGCAAAQSCLPTRLPLSRCAASQIDLRINPQSPLSAFLAQRSVACKCNCRSQCIGAKLIVISPHRSQGVLRASAYWTIYIRIIWLVVGAKRTVQTLQLLQKLGRISQAKKRCPFLARPNVRILILASFTLGERNAPAHALEIEGNY